MAAEPMEGVETPAADAAAPEADHITNLSLDILGTIKGSQTRHGLRHGDYLRYRQYCTRRVQRLRKSLKFLNGKGRYTKKTLNPSVIKNERFLHIPLVSAERCWSYGMQLRADNETNEPRPRLHALRKLEKAKKYAAELEALCSTTGDARTKLEAQAYAQFMNGTVALERGNFQEAISFYTHVRTVYEQLAKVGDPLQQQLCKGFVKDLEPHITLCEYKLSKSSGGNVDMSALRDLALHQSGVTSESLKATLDSVLAEERGKSAVSLESVHYRGQAVTVRSEKVRVLLVSVSEYVIELEKSTDQEERTDWYDKILMTLQDAKRLTQSDIKTTASNIKGQTQKEALELLSEYVTWTALGHTVARNLDLVQVTEAALQKQHEEDMNAIKHEGRRMKPDDVARLYAALCQNMSDMIDVANNRDDEDLAAQLGIKQLLYRSERCVRMAESYSNASKFREATALYERANELAESALAQASTDSTVQEALTKVSNRAQSAKSALVATAFLKTKKDTDAVTEQASDLTLAQQGQKVTAPLEQRLLDYIGADKNGNPHIAEFPPTFQAIPCKPLLFDLGYDELHYPEIEGGEEQKAKGGWFGGWLGGK